MPKIIFTTNPKIPNDKVDDWAGYVKDSIHDVSENEAERWLSKGMAEIITPKQAREMIKEVEEVVEKKVEEVKEVVSAPNIPVTSTATAPVVPTSRR